MMLHILPPEFTTVQNLSSDLAWLLSYASSIKEEEEGEDDEQCGKLLNTLTNHVIF